MMCNISTFIFLILASITATANTEESTVKKFDRNFLEIEDNWTAKEVGYKDSELIIFFRKNVGATQIAGHPDLENMVYLTITYIPANEQGLPSETDYKLISDFEDIDIPNIEHQSNSIHIGSVLKNGVYDFLFYVSDPDRFVTAVNTNNSKIKSFEVDLELANDPKWEIYHDFP